MRSLCIAVAAASIVMTIPSALEAQAGSRLSAEPFVAYGFFGELPESVAELEADVAIGGRVGYALTPQWGVFGTFQRSTPTATVGFAGGEVTVDHWSGGVEFSYVPRGGAEGMLPILLEAGLGQARYENGPSDLAVNIGIGSALQLSRNFAIRYGANDYISNYRNGDGVVNQIFVRAGAELTF